MKVLNSREKKKIGSLLAEEYGADEGLFAGHELYSIGKDTWLTTTECLRQNLGGIKVDSIGLLALRNGKPTINFMQLMFKTAQLTELGRDEARDFLQGRPLRGVGKVMSYRGRPLCLAKETADGYVRSN